MAALIGDVFADSSRFHNMIGVQRQHSHDAPYQGARSVSRSRDRESHQQQSRPGASPRRQGPVTSAAPRYPSQSRREQEEVAFETASKEPLPDEVVGSGGASRFPSPPPSSSPSEPSSSSARPQHAIPVSIPSAADHTVAPQQAAFPSSTSSTSTDATIVGVSSRAMPSPGSDSAPLWNPLASSQASPSNRPDSPIQTQTTIHVRDLNHIQSLAKADLLTPTGPGILNDPPLQQMKYEISSMPINDIIEMVAALLTKITTTNDLQHDAMNRNANHVKQAARSEEGGDGTMSPLSSSVLAFHGKNVPAITILSYLSRIHKYCPTTYEVFLSLLVYFDRMTERVNEMVMKSEDTKRREVEARAHGKSVPLTAAEPPVSRDVDTVMRDDGGEPSDETDSDLADDDDEGKDGEKAGDAAAQATYFVVDSFNIHRLIIAGVTCASKFFSDVFYTNSRYAKVCAPLSHERPQMETNVTQVGGLPLAELNHLELQFLLLNDFRLSVPVEDLEAYATMLVEFYAREVIAQRSRPVTGVD
ncbi:hypothetical protein OQA88_1292 [Cercophora sp. LCS_1]